MIADIEARRAERRATLEAARLEQYEIDLEAIDAIEIELGDANVKTVRVNYAPGLPALVAVRCPRPVEIKRYQDTIRPNKRGELGNPTKAAEDIGGVCLVYPPRDSELRAALLEQRPAMRTELGVEAIRLSEGRAEDEVKS